MKKTTGIVRKLDELGRITLPVEIRRSLNLEEGDAMGISVDGNKIIIVKDNTLQDALYHLRKALEIASENYELAGGLCSNMIIEHIFLASTHIEKDLELLKEGGIEE